MKSSTRTFVLRQNQAAAALAFNIKANSVRCHMLLFERFGAKVSRRQRIGDAAKLDR
jgi:hypothetical protein